MESAHRNKYNFRKRSGAPNSSNDPKKSRNQIPENEVVNVKVSSIQMLLVDNTSTLLIVREMKRIPQICPQIHKYVVI